MAMEVVESATRYKVSTGRGGAGNIHTSDSQISPKLVPQGSQTPSILQPVYSTGRGGAGNMRRNVDAKLTRRAQDVSGSDNEDLFIYSDEDYIGPVREHAEEEDNDRISSDKSGVGPTSNQMNKTRTKSNDARPKTIVLGRGGAGNIISPTASRKTNKKKTKKNETKGFWGNLKDIFA